jgi:hypothetical protein
LLPVKDYLQARSSSKSADLPKMRYYLDASALVKVYVPEQGSAWMARLLATEFDLMSARLGFVETGSALVRLAREGRVACEHLELAMVDLLAPSVRLVHPVELDESVAQAALALLRRHPLRGADAIHLASAVVASANVFLSSDLRLLAAAEEEGLTCLDPTAHAAEDEVLGLR